MGLVDGGELVVRALRAEGVEQIFAIPDISYTPIQRSAEEHGIRTVATRHESANAHMAEAWARVTGGVAVAMATMGPGVANVVPGVFTAWVEGYPLILIGTQRTDRADRSIRRGRFQHTPQLDVLGPITKFAASVPDAERAPEYVREAFRAALSGRPGPSYLEFPVQVLREEVEEADAGMPTPSHYRAAVGAPDPEAVDAAARLLADAELPLILAGQGAAQAGASNPLLALLERTGAGLMTTPGARGVIDEDDEHVVGQPLLSPAGARLAQEADVVLAVGTEVVETVGYGKQPHWAGPERQRWIQLDSDPDSIGVNREVDCALVGDAGKGLEALSSALGADAGPGAPRPLVAEVVGQERELISQLRETLGASDAHPIHPARLANEVATFFGPDAITCLDGGNTTLWATLFHRFHRPRSFLWTSHFGHLGTGLPYAIGAKLAAPDRPVYLFTGDSALGFNLSELETASREQLDLVVVVACDFAWSMEALGQQQEIGRTLGLETGRVRYDEVAKGLGCGGELVERAEEIRPALERAADAEGPVLVQVDIDPSENVSPPFLQQFLDMYAAEDG